MKKLIVTTFLICSPLAFAGGSMGGSPPAIISERIEVDPVEFQNIAMEALIKPGRGIMVGGKLVAPKLIDLEKRVIRMETLERQLIELKDFQVELPIEG